MRALAVTVVSLLTIGAAGAQAREDGLPAYVTGYASWTKVNKAPIHVGSAAHPGVKNVYTSKRQMGRRYPVSTIVVKTASPPGKRWLSLVATMRRVKIAANGGWRWEEFTRSSPTARFAKIGFPESGCAACHMRAKANDYVFTRR